MVLKADWVTDDDYTAADQNAVSAQVNANTAALAAGGSGDVTGPASSVDSEVAVFSSTTGKVIKRGTGSGIATLAAGVLGTTTAPAGSLVGTTATQTLTGKTISGSANTLTNISSDAFVDGTTNHVFTAADDTKLTGIAAGATANDTDANLKARANHTGTQPASTISDFSTAADARITAASLYRPGGTDVAITDGGTGASTLPAGLLKGAGTSAITAATAGTDYVTPTGSETLSNKTLTNPTITNYTESVAAVGNTGTAKTLDLTGGTVQTATLTGNCTFTMPAAAAGKSFVLYLKTGAGGFTATFTSVKWPASTAPTITGTANRMDILTFVADGSSWYGSSAQNYTP